MNNIYRETTYGWCLSGLGDVGLWLSSSGSFLGSSSLLRCTGLGRGGFLLSRGLLGGGGTGLGSLRRA